MLGGLNLALRWRLHPEILAFSQIISEKGKSMDSGPPFPNGWPIFSCPCSKTRMDGTTYCTYGSICKLGQNMAKMCFPPMPERVGVYGRPGGRLLSAIPDIPGSASRSQQ